MRISWAGNINVFLFTLLALIISKLSYSQTFINKSDEFGVAAFGAGIQGSGCSTFDWDEDGYDDLTLLSMDSVPMFFHNNGGNEFTRVYFEGINLADTIQRAERLFQNRR